MRLPKFDHVEPKSIQEASTILIDNPEAKIFAGGTDLLVNMKHRVETPPLIVNIKRISGLNFVEQKNGVLRIGSLTSLKTIFTHPLIAEKLPALALAASLVGSYHHQSMGTIGGNICQQNRCKYFNQSKWWRSSRALCFKTGGEICYVVNQREICYSSYCGDLAPVLLTYNARVVLERQKGKREISLERLFSGNGKAPLNLESGEILTQIAIPREASEVFSTYLKFANRESIDFPIVGTALWASIKKKEVRIAFTAVDRKPLRAGKVEKFLRGKELSQKTLQEAKALSSKEAKPVKTSIYSPAHKREIMGRLLEGGLGRALEEVGR